MKTANESARAEGRTEHGLPIDESFSRPASEGQIQRAAESLRLHNFDVKVVDTVAEARAHVASILPRDKTIFTSASETIRLSGLDEDINGSGTFLSVRQQVAKLDPRERMTEMRRRGATPDVVVGSVHAVTEDGALVAASASGSQLGPYAGGAARAIFVVGSQKVVPDLETAMRRIKLYSYPREDVRAREKYGMPSSLAKILILNGDWPRGRSTVVIVREPIGF